jgi:tetratricopeptide (TPR) repeat protein
MHSEKLKKKTFARTLLASLIFLGFVSGCSKNPAELQKKFMAEGRHYLSEGKASEAIIEFQNLLKVNPHSSKGHYWLGEAYLKKGWVLESVQEFREASREDPLFLGAHLALARYGVNSGQWEATRPEVEAILKIDPKNAEGWAIAGQRARARGKIEEAEKDLGRALSLDPASVRGLVAMGDLKRDETHPNQAKEFYRKAIARDPNSSRAWTGLGFVSQAVGQNEEARKDFAKAVEVDTSDLRSRIIQANFFAQQGDVKKAIALLNAIPAKKTDLRIPVKIAEYETMTGENEKAIRILHPYVRQKIQIPDIDFTLAKAYEQSGKRQEALDMVDRLLKLGSLPPLMKISAARILFAEGKPDDSRKLLASLEGTPHLSSLYWLTKGQDELRLGQPREAMRTVEEALKRHPGDPRLLLLLSDAQAFEKHDKAAIGILDSLLQKDPKNPAFISRKGTLLGRSRGVGAEIAYYRDAAKKYPGVPATEVLYLLSMATNGKLPDATREAESFLGSHPDNQTVRLLMAQFLLQSGRKDQAIKTYRAIVEKDPDNLQALVALAFQEFQSRKFSSAESFYRRALAIAPDDPNLNAGLGETLLSENQREAALASFRKSLSENPGQTVAIIELAKSEILSGQSQRAVARLAPLLKAPLPSGTQAQVHWLFGLASENGGDAAKARESLAEAVRLDPKNADFHASLGELFVSGSRWDKAVSEFDKSLALRPDDPPIRLQRSWAMANMAKGPSKIDRLKTLVSRASDYWAGHPGDLASGMLVARGNLLLNDPARALSAFDLLLSKHPSDSGALLGKSGILLGQGHLRQAGTVLGKLLAEDPDNARANLMMADIDDKEKDTQGVIDHLEKVHQRYPKWVQPALTLASAFLSRKNFAEAKNVAFTLHEAHPELAVALYLQASAEMGLGDYQSAKRHFRSLAKNAKKPAPLYNLVSIAAGKLGERDTEMKYLDLALQSDPGDPLILNNMAFTLAQGDQHLERALGYARKALGKVNQPFVQDTVGFVLYRMGRYSLAENSFRTAYDAHFRDPEFLFHMGMNDWKLGKKSEASDLLKKAVVSGKLMPEEQSQAHDALRSLSGGA